MFRCLMLICSAALAAAGDAATWKPQPVTVARTLALTTRPVARLVLRAEATGRIDASDLTVGGRVAGDGWVPVVRFDRAAAEAALAEAQARTAEAAAAVREAGIDGERAARERRHFEELLAADRKSGLVTREAELLFQRDLAGIAVRRAEVAVTLAQARLAQMRAGEAGVQATMTRLVVRAPAGWTTLRLLALPGQVVREGDDLAELVDLRALEADIELGEAELTALRAATPPVRTLRGAAVPTTLARLAPVSEPGARGRRVTLAIAAADLERAAGEAAGGIELRLDLPVAQAGGGWLVPRSFLREEHGTWSVRIGGQPRNVGIIEWRGQQAVVAEADLAGVAAVERW